jgi:hypothetical protein
MNKTVKWILFVVGGLLVVFVIGSFVLGIFSDVKPQKSIEMAKQKKMEKQTLSLPSDYTVVKTAEKQDTDYGAIYVTELSKDSMTIQIIAQPKAKTSCLGETVSVDTNTTACVYDENVQTKGPGKSYVWETSQYTMQLSTNDTSLTDAEFNALVLSYK